MPSQTKHPGRTLIHPLIAGFSSGCRRAWQHGGLASLGAAAATALGTLAIYSHAIEPFWLDVTHPTFTLSALPPALDGLVVAQLSDFHLHASCDCHDPVAQAVAACNDARPDVAVLTGDYLSYRKGINSLVQLLKKLEVRPAFAVLGNHDCKYGPSHRRALAEVFESVGISLLNNRAVAFERNGARVWFVGVGDGYSGYDRLDEALRGLGDGDRPRVLLTHYPDVVIGQPRGSVDVALAGHSHGAQIHLPIISTAALRNSDTVFSGGLYSVQGTLLYVNRGLGTSGHRVRLLARPELALVTLRSAPKQS
jgi:predicted MPP superfamily phosphohydrolase